MATSRNSPNGGLPTGRFPGHGGSKDAGFGLIYLIKPTKHSGPVPPRLIFDGIRHTFN